MTALDTVWMLTLPGDAGVVYEVGSTAKEVWDKVIERETMGTGVTQSDLVAQGFKASIVEIRLAGAGS